MTVEGISELGLRFYPWYGLTNMTSRDGGTVRRWQRALGRAIILREGEALTPEELSAAAGAMRGIAESIERDGGRPAKAAILNARLTEGERRFVQVFFWAWVVWLPVRLLAGKNAPIASEVGACLMIAAPLVYAGLLVRWTRAYQEGAERVRTRRCLACGYPLEAGAGAVVWCSECGCANLPAPGVGLSNAERPERGMGA